jgi:putative methionine-R-sulfoxide reductase with GAF domain
MLVAGIVTCWQDAPVRREGPIMNENTSNALHDPTSEIPTADNPPTPDITDAGAQAEVQAAGEDDDLRSSLTALSQLATGQMELKDVLTRVAEFAVRAIPGADGAGLTLIEAGHADTIVASAAFVSEVDAIQYGIGEGPCVTAAAEGRTMRSGSLGTDRCGPVSAHGSDTSVCTARCRCRCSPPMACWAQ